MLEILIDADMFAFRACAAVEKETEWDSGVWTLHAHINEAKAYCIEITDTAILASLELLQYTGNYNVTFCYSDSDANFRKKILPSYKANRLDKRKPVCYRGLIKWLKETYNTAEIPTLEADDVIGILATRSHNKTLIISGDKDMKSIPGLFYNFITNELLTISNEEANYWHLYQTLVGDTADNYSGCPSIGAVTATKLLEAKGATWNTVVEQYKKKGLTEKDALTQAQVARILRASDYNAANKEVKLWNPYIS